MSSELNPLLAGIDAPIDYAAVRPEHIAPAIESLLARARSAVEDAADPSLAADWESIITPLDDACEPLWRAWSVAAHLNAVVNTPALRDAYNAMLGPITEYSTWVGLHEGLYQQYLRLRATSDFDHWTPARKRVIDLAIRNFRLSGVELVGEAESATQNFSEQQSRVSQKFSENVLDAIDGWSLAIDDASRLEGIPPDALSAIKVEGDRAGYSISGMPAICP